MKKKYVLLKCWYKGDGHLVDDSYVASGSRDQMIWLAKSLHPENEMLVSKGDRFPEIVVMLRNSGRRSDYYRIMPEKTVAPTIK